VPSVGRLRRIEFGHDGVGQPHHAPASGAQALALDVRPGEPGVPRTGIAAGAHLIGIEDGEDMRMLQLRLDSDLAGEPRGGGPTNGAAPLAKHQPHCLASELRDHQQG
jgi:hypothetical protein